MILLRPRYQTPPEHFFIDGPVCTIIYEEDMPSELQDEYRYDWVYNWHFLVHPSN